MNPKLTNETENSLANVAERLGVLIKGRVHEEITQLGMGCPVDPGNLAQDLSCSTRDLPFVTPYVIYGPDGHPNSPAYGHLKLPHLN